MKYAYTVRWTRYADDKNPTDTPFTVVASTMQAAAEAAKVGVAKKGFRRGEIYSIERTNEVSVVR